MGGTSTDVSRYGGKYEHVFESTTAGVCIQAPQVLYYRTIGYYDSKLNMQLIMRGHS